MSVCENALPSWETANPICFRMTIDYDLHREASFPPANSFAGKPLGLPGVAGHKTHATACPPWIRKKKKKKVTYYETGGHDILMMLDGNRSCLESLAHAQQ